MGMRTARVHAAEEVEEGMEDANSSEMVRMDLDRVDIAPVSNGCGREMLIHALKGICIHVCICDNIHAHQKSKLSYLYSQCYLHRETLPTPAARSLLL